MVPYRRHAKLLVARGGPFRTERLRTFANCSGP